MKKSLLLTSIITLVLLVVALSTATFAWFSASSTVNVSVISFTASAGETLNELTISWSDEISEENRNTKIDFSNTLDLEPMIPKTLPVVGQSLDSFLMTLTEDGRNTTNFHAAGQVLNTQDNEYYYSSGSISAMPKVCKSLEKDGNKETFYLINMNEKFDMEISVVYSISGDLEKALCVAVFADEKLVGIMSGVEEFYYGDIAVGTKVADQTSENGIVAPSETLKFIVPANTAVPMKLVAWYNGVNIDDSGKDKVALLSTLQFKGKYTA